MVPVLVDILLEVFIFNQGSLDIFMILPFLIGFYNKEYKRDERSTKLFPYEVVTFNHVIIIYYHLHYLCPCVTSSRCNR